MNVLVTGGAGFIGSHLVERLVAEGHTVVVLDNESTGRRAQVPPAVGYLKGDVARPEDLEPVFTGGLDAVLHVAGQVSLIRAFTDPATDLRTNVQGTVNVLQACLKHRVPRLLYASSMQAYGDTDVVPTPEDTPCHPASYYGITKYAAERFVHTTAERADLDFDFRVTSFRMYNVYGPRQALDNPYQGVLGIFLGNLLRGEPLTIFGDGEQSRDFVYVGDVADAWVRALENPASYGGVFNLGSGRETSIARLADLALAALGLSRRDHAVRHAPGRPGELRRVAADVTRARAVLGWEPRTSFADGLAQTVRWAVQQAEAGGPAPGAAQRRAPNEAGGAWAGRAR
jgi:UDP-glucose 4-epimerase